MQRSDDFNSRILMHFNDLKDILAQAVDRKNLRLQLKKFARNLDQKNELIALLDRLPNQDRSWLRIRVELLLQLPIWQNLQYDFYLSELLKHPQIPRSRKLKLFLHRFQHTDVNDPAIPRLVTVWLKDLPPKKAAYFAELLNLELPDRPVLWSLLQEYEARDLARCVICQKNIPRKDRKLHLLQQHGYMLEDKEVLSLTKKARPSSLNPKTSRESFHELLLQTFPLMPSPDRKRYFRWLYQQEIANLELAPLLFQEKFGQVDVCHACLSAKDSSQLQLHLSDHSLRYGDLYLQVEDRSPWGIYHLTWPNGFRETHSIPGIITPTGKRWLMFMALFLLLGVVGLLLPRLIKEYPSLFLVAAAITIAFIWKNRWQNRSSRLAIQRNLRILWQRVVPRIVIDEPPEKALHFIAQLCAESDLHSFTDIAPERLRSMETKFAPTVIANPDLVLPFFKVTRTRLLRLTEQKDADLPRLLVVLLQEILQEKLPATYLFGFQQLILDLNLSGSQQMRTRLLLLQAFFQKGFTPRDLRAMGRYYPGLSGLLQLQNETSILFFHRLHFQSDKRGWEATFGLAKTAFELAADDEFEEFEQYPNLLLYQPQKATQVGDRDPLPVVITTDGVRYANSLISTTQTGMSFSHMGLGTQRLALFKIGKDSYQFFETPAVLREIIYQGITWYLQHLPNQQVSFKDFLVTPQGKKFCRVGKQFCPKCQHHRQPSERKDQLRKKPV